MAEPNWELWESILQLLQADTAELKRDMQIVKSDLAELRGDMRLLKGQLRYAVGTAGVAEYEALQAGQTAQEVRRLVDELIARFDDKGPRPDA